MSTKPIPPLPVAPPVSPRAAERIRATAAELFYQQGIRAIGVEQIVNCAGVTKPSLYRSFASKDELAAAYLHDYDTLFWQRFEAPAEQHPDDPRAQLLAYLDSLSRRASVDGYRGCGLTNAVIEYPDARHPARRVAVASKQRLRQRLLAMCVAMGARAPDELADGLLLLIEGCYASGQVFGKDGPVRSVVAIASSLIDANTER
jgi:AcrR family transcriptional regulator